MIKKRNGSSMITVLGVTLVLVFLSGIILSLTMGTMKANTNQKEVEDVQFAAESGLEIGRSHLEKIALGHTPGGPSPNYAFDTEATGTPEETLAQGIENGKITNVAIKATPLGADKILLESKATDIDGTEKTVKVKLEAYEKTDNDIFDYGIVAGQGNVNIGNVGTGANNIGCNVSGATVEDENGNPTNSLPSNNSGNAPIEKNKFGDITFLTNKPQLEEIKAIYSGQPRKAFAEGKFYDGKTGAEITPTVIECDLAVADKMTIDGKVYKLSDLGNKNNIPAGLDLNNVVLMKIKGHGMLGHVEVLLANTKHITLEAEKISLEIINGILLNKGTVELAGTGSMKFVDSTIYSEDIKAGLNTSFEIIGSIKQTTSWPISVDHFNKLNDFLAAILPGWNDVTNQAAAGVVPVGGSFGN
ncbi:MAG: hypothetical protein ACRC30_03675 [Clostridium sp.]